ncbi:TIGR03086 family protein [Saccharopolyspora aridisoli]|uniref:TIGR03086 family protein n=1 Tax=Saccharopolyspora aridisoli TaxID=2530385 RepID=A0A4R4UPV8_9PSEU|nr:TIGR03086 family metal-binding protein [Saccharopolyspora aridisoli]TDC94041.1 TIGR03086 family protein [Saccharopolyspora aridisoli]
MQKREPVTGSELVGLLEGAFEATSAVLQAVPSQRFGNPSPCDGWTAGQVGSHLVGGARYFGQVAAGQATGLPAEDPRIPVDEVATAFAEAARLNLAAFSRPGVLDQQLPFAFGPTPGWVVANISLSEAVIHGWDLARAVDLPYSPDDAAVDAVMRFQSQSSEDELRTGGMFGAATSAPQDASPFEELLAFTGREP